MSITIQIIILVIVNCVKHILSAMLNNSSNLFLQYETHQKPEEFYNEKAENDHSKKLTFKEGYNKYLENCRQRNLIEGTIGHYGGALAVDFLLKIIYNVVGFSFIA